MSEGISGRVRDHGVTWIIGVVRISVVAVRRDAVFFGGAMQGRGGKQRCLTGMVLYTIYILSFANRCSLLSSLSYDINLLSLLMLMMPGIANVHTLKISY